MFDEAEKTVSGLIPNDFLSSYQQWIESLGGETAALRSVEEPKPTRTRSTSVGSGLTTINSHVRRGSAPLQAGTSTSPGRKQGASPGDSTTVVVNLNEVTKPALSSGGTSDRVRSPPVLSRTKSRSALMSPNREKGDLEVPPSVSPTWMRKKNEVTTSNGSQETSSLAIISKTVQTCDYPMGHTSVEGHSDASSQEGEHAHLVEVG